MSVYALGFCRRHFCKFFCCSRSLRRSGWLGPGSGWCRWASSGCTYKHHIITLNSFRRSSSSRCTYRNSEAMCSTNILCTSLFSNCRRYIDNFLPAPARGDPACFFFKSTAFKSELTFQSRQSAHACRTPRAVSDLKRWKRVGAKQNRTQQNQHNQTNRWLRVIRLLPTKLQASRCKIYCATSR